MQKYYQVFLSSITNGFREIRVKLINEIIKQDRFFPIAMEFMTSDDNTYDMLYNYMKSSDICILFLSQNTGSKIGKGINYISNNYVKNAIDDYKKHTYIDNAEDLSYTELEYAIARYLNIKILAFVEDSVVEQCESENATSDLQRFYNSLRERAGYTQWSKEPECSEVINALNRFVNNHTELKGWIREDDSNIFKSATNAGIVDISLDGILSREKLRTWITQSTVLRMCYTTGRSFIVTNGDVLSDFVANGGNIQLLCCKPYSNELFDIQNIEEKIYGDRQQIHREFTDVYSELINIYNMAKAKGTAHKNIGKIEVGFLSTLLRSSFLIFENTSNNKKTGWFTITLPPAKSRETVSFEIISNDESVSSNNLILRTINHFNSIWNYAISKDEVFLIGSQNDALKDISDQNPKKYWEEKEKIAVFNTKKRKRNRKVLIEVAAQHPLTDGLYPNEEFAARLDMAILLYYEKKNKGYDAEIYVPGSLHLDYDGVPDDCSLSRAGCDYLVEKGIPVDCIHGEDWNDYFDESRFHKGVYNSADECFIASQFFLKNEHEFKELYSICSPNQLMRKTLFYIEFGVIPLVVTVPQINMYHNFFNELFSSVTKVIESDHSWQGEFSEEAIRTRKERLPGYKETISEQFSN